MMNEFTHIYIEQEALDYPETQKVLQEFPDAQRIIIRHYKDIFCRRKQNFLIQKQAQQLILAVKHNNLIYPGAPVCQSFEHHNFYYTSCMMNCLYDCEYCYLRGMYPSANVVIFVNLNDIFEEVKKQLRQHDLYLCVSYDTDLAAFEHMTGYTRRWMEFVKACNQTEKYPLSIEIRTKSAHISMWQELKPVKGVILAYTLSPESMIQKYEHKTPSLLQRLASIETAIEQGYQVRLCFDPMLYCKDWKEQYRQMIETVYEHIDLTGITDVSMGTFRVSQDYLKKMRKDDRNSEILAFPYQNDQGYYDYGHELATDMINYLKSLLLIKFREDQLFIWEP